MSMWSPRFKLFTASVASIVMFLGAMIDTTGLIHKPHDWVKCVVPGVETDEPFEFRRDFCDSQHGEVVGVL